MKKFVFYVLFTYGLLLTQANAGLVISNFAASANSLSFEIDGQLDGPLPFGNRQWIDIGNTVSPLVFITTPFESANTFSFTGTQSLQGVHAQSNWGGFIELVFTTDLAVGESLQGVLTATWLTPLIDVYALPDTLNVSWGDALGFGAAQGSFSTLSTPTPAALFILGLAGLVALRKGRLAWK